MNTNPSRAGMSRIIFGLLLFVTIVASATVTALLVNIFERKSEARSPYIRLVDVDEDTTDPAVNNTVLARMLQRALTYLPGLADLNAIRTWTGFRAATPDSLPIIGTHPVRPHLWLAVGHEGLGVTTAPATAQLLAAQITGSAPPIDPMPYAAQRIDSWGAP